MSEVGVIFDMDGVLVLTEDAHWQSWLARKTWRDAELPDVQKLLRADQSRLHSDPVRAGCSADEVLVISDEKESAFRDIVRGKVPLALGLSNC